LKRERSIASGMVTTVEARLFFAFLVPAAAVVIVVRAGLGGRFRSVLT
jgi:hypothetical protein